MLIAPELRWRGPVRAVAMAGLIVLWEAANLAGFIAERLRRRRLAAVQTVNSPAANEETAV
ncbi:MAG: hypothetical protein FJW31_13755 [Acidobacteria bacterium]|nr:hypothetical protein [Acidobacteriota bacterium]MBM3815272.1 hypothetical protein [Acidimicrobiia bacterium]